MSSASVTEALQKVIDTHEAIFAAAAVQHTGQQEAGASASSTTPKTPTTQMGRQLKTVCRVGVKRHHNIEKGLIKNVRKTPSSTPMRPKVVKKPVSARKVTTKASFSPKAAKKTTANLPSIAKKTTVKHPTATKKNTSKASSTSRANQPSTSAATAQHPALPPPAQHPALPPPAQHPALPPTAQQPALPQPAQQHVPPQPAQQHVPPPALLPQDSEEAVLVSDYDNREGMCTQLLPDGYTRISFPGVTGRIAVPAHVLGSASKAADDFLRAEKIYRNKREEHFGLSKAIHTMAQYIVHFFEQPVHYPIAYVSTIHNKSVSTVSEKLADQPEPAKTALWWATKYYADHLDILSDEQRSVVLKRVVLGLMANVSNQKTLLKNKGLTALSEEADASRPRRHLPETGADLVITENSRSPVKFFRNVS